MTLSLAAACLWALIACLIGTLPSRDRHWRAAYLLIAAGLPILIWVTWSSGLLVGLFVLVAAGSILRWPVIYLWRWIRARLRMSGRRP